jgi:hypothetical protein
VNFEEYLVQKKIDSGNFKSAEPARWEEWSDLFAEISEPSFTAQKLYLINPTRRKYRLKEQPGSSAPAPDAAPKPSLPVVPPGRPVMKPKIN